MKSTAFNFLFLFFAFCLCIESSAQTPDKTIHTREQLWLGYFNQTRFSNKFGFWIDVHYRQTDHFIERPFQFLISTRVDLFYQR